MKALMFVAGALCLVMTVYPALAQKSRVVTCAGILIEVDMNPSADFPMAVVYDNTECPQHAHLCSRSGSCWPLAAERGLLDRRKMRAQWPIFQEDRQHLLHAPMG
jgi:hypothetical protein